MLLLDIERNLSHEGFMVHFRGDGQGEGQGDLSVSAFFSNFFSLKYSICQGDIFWGSVS